MNQSKNVRWGIQDWKEAAESTKNQLKKCKANKSFTNERVFDTGMCK